jgi:hypothetical protein
MKKLFSSKASKRTILALLACIPVFFGINKSDDIRQAFNEASNAGVAYEQRDVMTRRTSDGDFSAVISAEHISRTGSVPVYAAISPRNYSVRNPSIDWKADDAFTKAFTKMETAASNDISENPGLMALAQKTQWTPEERRAWDEPVSNIIATAVQQVPGLDKYRSSIEDPKVPDAPHLNDLSGDIAAGTSIREFDCKGMSIVKCVLQQRMADRFLPAGLRTKYFYATGTNEMSIFDDAPGPHAFIVLVKDGTITGIVEATETSDVYRAIAKGSSFSEFLKGGGIVCGNGAVYGFDFKHDQADDLRRAAGIKPHADIMRDLRKKPARQPGGA